MLKSTFFTKHPSTNIKDKIHYYELSDPPEDVRDRASPSLLRKTKDESETGLSIMTKIRPENAHGLFRVRFELRATPGTCRQFTESKN